MSPVRVYKFLLNVQRFSVIPAAYAQFKYSLMRCYCLDFGLACALYRKYKLTPNSEHD